MKKLIVVLCLFASSLAFAQPGSSGSAPTPPPPAGGSGSNAGAPEPPPETPPAPPAAGDARKACTDAMNADPAFAQKIAEVADANAAQKRLELDLAQHDKAAKAIAKNEKHVILAYAAMWLLAAAFLGFLWFRQQALRTEIAQLKTDLDAATKDAKK
jgi:hypothetical protein